MRAPYSKEDIAAFWKPLDPQATPLPYKVAPRHQVVNKIKWLTRKFLTFFQ